MNSDKDINLFHASKIKDMRDKKQNIFLPNGTA
jgi:hypothetical protein